MFGLTRIFKRSGAQTTNIEATDDLGVIARWLDALPLTNSFQSAESLLALMASLVQTELSPDAVLARLELIHPIAWQITQMLKAQYLQQGGALIPDNWVKNTRARALHRAILASTYQQVVDLSDDQGLEVIGRLTQLGLVHAQQVLLTSFYSYRPVPEQIWQQVYQLYSVAERLDITTFHLVSKTGPRIGSIYDEFAVMLMLGVCNPYNLTPQALDTLLEAMRGWTQKIKLQCQPTQTSVFAYSGDFDAAPVYRELISAEQIDENYRGLDFSPLITGFDRLLKDMLQSDRPVIDEFLPLELINHIYYRWRGPVKRQSREIQAGTYQVIIGLAASSAFFREQFCTKHSSHLNSVQIQREEEVTQSLSRRNEEASLKKRLLTEYPELQKGADKFLSAPNYFYPHEWELVNQSEQGICLQRHALEIPFIMSGQIISLSKDDAWHIGVIRWVQHRDESLTIGVEVLSSDGFPILIQNQSQMSTGHCLAGLLSVIPDTVNQKSIIITPNIGYDEHQEVLLQGLHYGMRAKLLNCTEASSFFKLFEYEVKEHLK